MEGGEEGRRGSQAVCIKYQLPPICTEDRSDDKPGLFAGNVRPRTVRDIKDHQADPASSSPVQYILGMAVYSSLFVLGLWAQGTVGILRIFRNSRQIKILFGENSPFFGDILSILKEFRGKFCLSGTNFL